MRELRVAPCRQLALDLGELSGEDRWNMLPEQARLRVLAKPYGVVKVDAAPGVIHITFKPDPPIDPMRIMVLALLAAMIAQAALAVPGDNRGACDG